MGQTKTLQTMTPDEFQQSDIRQLLADIRATGKPLQIDWDGKLFEIVTVEKKSKLDDLVPHPEVYIGNPEDLVNISWEHELNLDLPS